MNAHASSPSDYAPQRFFGAVEHLYTRPKRKLPRHTGKLELVGEILEGRRSPREIGELAAYYDFIRMRGFMSSRLYDNGRNNFLTAAVNWTGHTQKALLMDGTQTTGTTGTWFKFLSNATNANPVVYTSNAHGFSNNDVIVVGAVGGNSSANQIGLAASVATNTFQLTTLEGALNVAGSGAYTASTGYAMNLTQASVVGDILGTRLSTDVTLAGTSASRGVANATSPFQWSLVPSGNTASFVVLYDANGGSDATNKLECFMDGKTLLVVDKAVSLNDTSITIEPAKSAINHTQTGTLFFSNGQSITLTADVAQGDRFITIAAAGGAIPIGHQADVQASGAGIPLATNGGNISFSIGSLYFPTSPTGLFAL